MKRKFKKPDYIATANAQISLGEASPANHLERFVVDIVAQPDLSTIYARYGLLFCFPFSGSYLALAQPVTRLH
jgi:hypothetical protein